MVLLKTAIRIALIAVVLLSIANTASAVVAMTEFDDGCYCVHIEGSFSYPSPVPTRTQLSMPTYPVDVDAKVCKSGDVITVTELNSEPGDVNLTSLVFSSLYKEQITLAASGTGIYNSVEYPFSGEMTLTGDGENYDGSGLGSLTIPALPDPVSMTGSFSATIKPCAEPNPIPEFPTIALPMIAILGLAFMIQRRKE